MEELTDKGNEAGDLRKCKRCLLYETADKAAYESVRSYIASMKAEDKAAAETYEKRLNICRECDYLLAGMCRKCGCYAEVRAAGARSGCPGGKW